MKKITIFLMVIILLFSFISCRSEEDSKIKIDGLSFNSQRVNISIGEELSIGIITTPQEAKNNENVNYSLSNNGIIEILSNSNDGVVVKGKTPGMSVVIAKVKNATAYVEVLVEGGDFVAQPYIMLQSPVIEIKENEMRQIQVNLYGGTPIDHGQFEFELLEDDIKDNIRISKAMNVLVVHGDKSGHQRVKISHPRAEHDSELLVFVRRNDEAVKFITSEKNVFLVQSGEQFRHFTVQLYGGYINDIRNFEYEVIEGSDVIEYHANNDTVNVRGLKAGSAVIRVSHPDAELDFDIRIISVEGNNPYITIDKTFIMLELNKNDIFNASVENPKTVNALNEFSYNIENNERNIIDVVQTNNQFFVYAKNGGVAKIIISNNQAEYSREVLIFVRTGTVYKDDYYITTSQNVIQTQVGDKDIELQMVLVGGNLADANGFTWEVSDGTIIEVEATHGNRTYKIQPEIQRSQINITSVFPATAIISPKRIGTSYITVYHSKSGSTASVLVKVYPKGTFSGNNVSVKIVDRKYGTEGLVKVLLNNPNYDDIADLEIISGKIEDLGEVDWSVKDGEIVVLDSLKAGKTNALRGVKSGMTKVRVENGGLRTAQEAIVIVGTQEELNSANIIYVENMYQTIGTEQVVRLQVKNSQNSELSGFTVNIVDKDKVNAVMNRSELILQGKEPGETTINITHPNCQPNGIDIVVRVEKSGLSMEYPYYISGTNLVGVVKGKTVNIKVDLVGAPNSELGKLKWEIEKENVVEMIANGTEATITGISEYQQTKILISHPKVNPNDKKTIVIYTVLNENELNNKVILDAEKRHYLLTKGQEIFISLITNTTDTNKKGISWSVKQSDTSINISHSYDSALISALRAGNAEITIKHDDNITPLTIFVSVIEGKADEKYLNHPPTIEILIGESKIINLMKSTQISQSELNGIKWSLKNNDNYVEIDTANKDTTNNSIFIGESLYMLGKNKGVCYLNIEQSQLGYKQSVIVLCASTRAELENMYVITAEKTFYKMNEGDEVKISLGFGISNFPENEKANIKWETKEKKGVVEILGSGQSALIKAKAEGREIVTIKCEGVAFNELNIEFEVYPRGVNTTWYEWDSSIVKTKGILVGKNAEIEIKYKLDNQIVNSGYSLLKIIGDDDEYVGAEFNNNTLVLQAKKTGQRKIQIRHDFIKDPLNILVYTALTEDELLAFYPIIAEKNNYMLKIGQEIDININTDPDKDNINNNLANITWRVTNPIGTYNNLSKKQMRVKAENVGEMKIEILNKPSGGEVKETIYVTSVTNETVDMSKRINTENIIGMIVGTEKTTTIVTNLSEVEISSLEWETENPNVVTVRKDGKSAVLNAVATGETYVTVSYGTWLKRNILVYVCNTEDQLRNYKALNMENQYIRLGLNKTAVLPVYYAPNKPVHNSAINTLWEDVYQNEVVELKQLDKGDKIEIKGLNEGVAVLDAVNNGRSGVNKMMRIFIEVSSEYGNFVQENQDLKYLTTSKTVYVLDYTDPNSKLELSVSGIGMSPVEMMDVKWETASIPDKKLISLQTGKGAACTVFHNNGAGEETIRISHAKAQGILEIKVICTDKPELASLKMINFKDVVNIGLNQTLTLDIDINNVTNPNSNLIQITQTDKPEIAEVVKNGMKLEIKGKKAGQTKFRIDSAEAELGKEVLIIVSSTEDGLMYFTTKDNFNVIGKGEYKTLSVEVVGMDMVNSNDYEWVVSTDDLKIIDKVPNGKNARIYGKSMGTAKIEVKHRDPNYDFIYPVIIYVRVTEADIDPIYITTKQNIVQLIQNQSMNVEVDLINGNIGHEQFIGWDVTNNTKHIIEVHGSGKNAIVKGLSPGIGRIRVHNTSVSFNEIEILVMVESPIDNGIYISTASNYLQMKPGEMGNIIQVQLVGGTAQDNTGFTWEHYYNDSVERLPDGQSKPVVSIVQQYDRCFVNTLVEGEARILIKHPKTHFQLEIVIDVRYFTGIEFDTKSPNKAVTVNMGETLSVPVNAPTGVRVFYNIRNLNADQSKVIAQISATNRVVIVEGIQDGNCIIEAYNSTGSMYDELLVQVLKVNNAKVRYIITEQNLINMQKNEASRTLKASTFGEKNSGELFSSDDDSNIYWHIISGGSNVIKFAQNVNPFRGNEASIIPVGIGETEILLRHDDMPSYTRRIYIKVTDDTSSEFKISKKLINLQIGQVDIVSAEISPKAEQNYDEPNVRWYLRENDCIRIDPLQGKNITIYALKEGFAVLECHYKEGITEYCNIIVEPENDLQIISSLEILPGLERVVTYSTKPENAEVTFQVQNMNNAVSYVHNKDTKSITIVGSNPGQAIFTLGHGNIKKILSVNCHNNYEFKILNIYHYESDVVDGKPTGELRKKSLGNNAVRGIPGMYYDVNLNRWKGPYYVEYHVTPGKDKITETKYSKDQRGSDFVGLNIDTDAQLIEITGFRGGFTELQFESDALKDTDKYLEIKVFMNYDIIDFEFEIYDQKSKINPINSGFYPVHEKGRTIFTEFDKRQMALRIGDGETIYLYANVDESIYGTLHGLKIEEVIIESNNNINDYIVSYNANPYLFGTPTAINRRNVDLVKIQAVNKNQITTLPYESRASSTFVGMLVIKYSQPYGFEENTVFHQRYMLYYDVWNRKKSANE